MFSLAHMVTGTADWVAAALWAVVSSLLDVFLSAHFFLLRFAIFFLLLTTNELAYSR